MKIYYDADRHTFYDDHGVINTKAFFGNRFLISKGSKLWIIDQDSRKISAVRQLSEKRYQTENGTLFEEKEINGSPVLLRVGNNKQPESPSQKRVIKEFKVYALLQDDKNILYVTDKRSHKETAVKAVYSGKYVNILETEDGHTYFDGGKYMNKARYSYMYKSRSNHFKVAYFCFDEPRSCFVHDLSSSQIFSVKGESTLELLKNLVIDTAEIAVITVGFAKLLAEYLTFLEDIYGMNMSAFSNAAHRAAWLNSMRANTKKIEDKDIEGAYASMPYLMVNRLLP